MEDASPRPLLAYDGACGFCLRWIERWRVDLDGRVELAPYQEVAERLEATRADLARAIHFVDERGRVSTGAGAILRALARVPGRGLGLEVYERLPGARPVAEAVYAQVARRRGAAGRLCDWTVGRDLTRPGFARSRRLFVALMGAVYAIAFGSLWVQLQGLYGSDGILPIARFLGEVRAANGAAAWWPLPTVFWAGASDPALHGACLAGLLLAVAAALGVAPRVAFVLLWLLYLSFVTTGRVFLGYQWDALLLEAGLLACLYAPPGLWLRHARTPPEGAWSRFLLRWLLFRLVFLSGAVKLLSDDPTWADGTALEYHYWTQPLPNALAVRADALPDAVQRASVVVMFLVELAAPFLLFGPRRVRHGACAVIAVLMTAISATGNYGFFTLLTLVLCLAQVDDRALTAWLPRRLRRPSSATRTPDSTAFSGPLRVATACVLGVVLVLTGRAFARRLELVERSPRPLEWLAEGVAPLRSFNGYGLFAVMTTERPEIEVEGSLDGVTWQPYAFRYKPGALDRAPVLAGVHMPRLDWQTWFAALRGWRGAPWFNAFAQRLLEGSPAVLGLLAEDPFEGRVPRFLRATAYRYRFAPPAERESSGAWWRRERIGAWCPVLTLREGELVLAR